MTTKNRLNGCPETEGRNGNHNELAATLVKEACDALYVANAPLDFIAQPMGAGTGQKHPCEVKVRIGGPAANGGRVFVANGYGCTVVSLQGEEWAESCRQKFRELGIQSWIIERNSGSGAVTLGVPNGKPGILELYCQRISPNLQLKELTGRLRRRIRKARVVIVGPMAEPDEETREVLRCIAAEARYAVLQPHPDLVRHATFGEVAARFDLVVLNASEASLRDTTTDDLVKHALRLRHDLNEDTDFIITNGPDQGLAWIKGHWWPFDPPLVSCVVSDVGAGDVLTGSFVTEYHLKGLPVRIALNAATETATRWVSGQRLVDTMSASGDSHDGSLPDGCLSRSWAEISL